MKKENSKRILIFFVLFTLALFVCMQTSFAPSGSYSANCDAAIYKYVGFSITKGQVPYLDTFDNKGPVFYYLNALGELINGTYGIFIVELILMFIATIFCYKSAKLLTNKTISLFSTIIVFTGLNTILWHGNMTEEYALPFTFMALYYFLKYLKSKNVSLKEIVIIGTCFASCFLIRANLIAIFVGFILVIFIDMLVHKKFKDLFKAIGSFLLGALIIIIPIALYLGSKGALMECIKQVYIEPNIYFKKDITFIEKSKLLYSILSNLTNCGLLFIIFYIIYVPYIYLKKSSVKNKIIHLAMFLSILINMYLVILSNADPSHYAMSFIPLLILPITIILSLISENIRINKTMCLLLITLLFAWSGITTCIQEIYGNIIGKYDKTFYNTIANYADEDEYVYLFDGYQLLYMTKRLSASRYVYISLPGDNVPTKTRAKITKDRLSELLNDLKAKKPKVILMSDKSYERYSSTKFYDFNKYKNFLEKEYIKENNKIYEYNIYVLKNS